MAVDPQIRAEPATLADIPVIVEIIKESLDPEGKVFPHDAHGTKYASDVYEALLKADKNRVTVFVVRDTESIAVATGTLYNIDEGEVFTTAWRDWGIPLQPGVIQEVLDAVFGAWAKRQNKLLYPEPRVFVEAMATRKAWQNRGCGSAILAEGDKMADLKDVPLYVDGGAPEFYKKCGYEEILDTSGVKASSTTMLRKRKSERI